MVRSGMGHGPSRAAVRTMWSMRRRNRVGIDTSSGTVGSPWVVESYGFVAAVAHYPGLRADKSPDSRAILAVWHEPERLVPPAIGRPLWSPSYRRGLPCRCRLLRHALSGRVSSPMHFRRAWLCLQLPYCRLHEHATLNARQLDEVVDT